MDKKLTWIQKEIKTTTNNAQQSHVQIYREQLYTMPFSLLIFVIESMYYH